MKTTYKKNIFLILLFALALIFGIFLGSVYVNPNLNAFNSLYNFITGKNTKVNKILTLVKNKYVDNVDIDSMEDLAVNQILGSLDPHTVYLPANAAQQQNENLEGNFEGIGISYFLLQDTILVTYVRPYSPAQNAGLKKGDKIFALNGINFKPNTLNADFVVDKLRGKKGSVVKVSLFREGAKINDLKIVRDKILISSIDAAYLLNAQTGFIKITNFGANTDEDFIFELQKLEALGIKNLILDLRGNGGGYLEAAIALTDHFLANDKLIVYTQGLHEPRTYYKATANGLFENGKIALLVDEGTASASEIVAGALQDWDRSLIIGRRTFGKGLVQQQFVFNDGSAMNLTVARYYTPSGRSIQKPYKNGTAYYKDELNRRLKKGEFTSLDSTLADTALFSSKLKYKTAAGKPVYAGGGIMPDIFIALDTNQQNSFYNAVLKQSLTTKFAYSTLIKQTKIDAYSSAIDFINSYQITTQQYQQFKAYCNTFKIIANLNQLEIAKPLISKNLKTILVKYYYGDEGYYRYLNNDDVFVKTALDKIENP